MATKNHLEDVPTLYKDYVVHPSAVGAKSIRVDLPNIDVTPEKHNSYKSAFNPTAVWEPAHSALETVGKGLDYVTPNFIRPVLPYLSASQWIGTLRGKGFPGSETNDGFGNSIQDQYLNEMFDFGTSYLPLGKLAFDGTKWGKGVARNIKHRNEHAYATIAPYGYDAPINRFKAFAKSILSGEENLDYLTGRVFNAPKDIISYNRPTYKNPRLAYQIANVTRDEAWRKYLGLPSRLEQLGHTPAYLENVDGTVRYNMEHFANMAKKQGTYIEPALFDSKNGVVGDWITGSHGGVNQTLTEVGKGISTDAGKRFGIGRMIDTWDLHPFRDSHTGLSKLPKRITDGITGFANKLYTKGFDAGIYGNTKFGRNFGYKYLGGSYLNKLRYGNASIPILYKPTFYKGMQVGAEMNPKLVQLLEKLSNKEIGTIIGGKPFTLDNTFKYTQIPEFGTGKISLKSKNGTPGYKNVLGWEADNNILFNDDYVK